jgi:hypothetical protein
MPDPQEPEIECGAIGGDLRYWLAGEARRQGEVRLVARERNIAAMEARAASVLSWSVATMVGLALAASQGRLLPVALASGVFLLLSSVACVEALWPSTWHPPGYDFATLRTMDYPSELEVLESIALGYGAAIQANDRRTTRFGRLLRFAWVAFLSAPVAGAIAAALVSVL